MKDIEMTRITLWANLRVPIGTRFKGMEDWLADAMLQRSVAKEYAAGDPPSSQAEIETEKKKRREKAVK